MLVFVLEGRDHLAKDINRVGHSTPVGAGVQVSVGAAHFHFHIGHAAKAYGDGWVVHANHVGIRYQDHVCLEALLVGEDKFVQVVRADFLFPFDHKLDIAGEVACGHHRFKGLDVHVKLPFVVCSAARKNSSLGVDGRFLEDWLKWWGIPQLVGVCRLHVVVAVNQYGGEIWVDYFFSVDDREAWGFTDFYPICTGLFEGVFDKIGCRYDVSFEFGIRTYRRDAEEVKELLQKAIFVFFEVGSYGHGRKS